MEPQLLVLVAIGLVPMHGRGRVQGSLRMIGEGERRSDEGRLGKSPPGNEGVGEDDALEFINDEEAARDGVSDASWSARQTETSSTSSAMLWKNTARHPELTMALGVEQITTS